MHSLKADFDGISLTDISPTLLRKPELISKRHKKHWAIVLNRAALTSRKGFLWIVFLTHSTMASHSPEGLLQMP